MIAGGVVALLMLLLPWWEGGASPFGLFATQTLVFVVAGAALVNAARSRVATIRCGWELPLGAAILALSLLGGLLAPYRFGAFLVTWDRIVAGLLAAAAVAVLSAREGERTIPGLWIGALAAAGAAQAIKVLLEPAPVNLTSSGSFANASQLGAWLNLTILASAGAVPELWRRAGWPRRVSALLVVGILAGVAAILKTGSRAALASLALAAGVWTLRAAGGQRPAVKRALWAGVAILAVASAVSVSLRFQRIADPYRYERLSIWRAGIQAMIDHPVLGMGPGMFETLGQRYNFPLERETFRYSKRASSTHSTLVQAGAESGVPGLLLAAGFMALLGGLAIREASSGGRRAGAAMGLLACLLHGLVDTPFAVPAITLSLIPLSLAWLTPDRLREAPLAGILPWPRGVAGGIGIAAAGIALVYLHAGAVALPWVAHVRYEAGVRGSRPGEPSPALDDAIRLGPLNPLYVATRAEHQETPGAPLDLPGLFRIDRDLSTARSLNPGDPGTLVALGRLHARACFDLSAEVATASRAERYYREAIATGARDPRIQVELASFLLSQGRGGEAIPLLREAIELEPRFVRAHLFLAKALEEAGRPAEAQRAMAAQQEALEAVRGYFAKNAYEADLLRLETPR